MKCDLIVSGDTVVCTRPGCGWWTIWIGIMPRAPRCRLAPPLKVIPLRPLPPGLPGTRLKELLSSKLIGWLLGKKAKGCSDCKALAAQMDCWGPDECEQRIPEILKQMEKNAEKLGATWSETVARWFVNRAISLARKVAAEELPDT